MVFAGYWNQPEETARVMQHGYFMTGDLGTWDGEGSIQLVDRAKDVIISGGENISSIEVEEVLYRHPAVQEAAVIGVPSEEWGETPLAVVVRRSAVEAPELRDFLRSQLAHFKVPTRYEFVEALPRTATGKLKKFELREPYWRGLSRRIH
jgi:fatty-acyl-CoA synthase